MLIRSLLIAAMVSVSPAAAQPAPADSAPAATGSDIVVEANRNRKAEIQNFVEALTPARAGEQLSRFTLPVCPAAYGLLDGQNDAIVARMKAVAGAAGIKVGGERCAPNALLLVVRNKDEFVAALQRKFPYFFQDPLGAPVSLQNSGGATVAWHVDGLLDSDGIRAAVIEAPTGGRTYQLDNVVASRIRSSTQPDFLSGVIVIEVNALVGLTTTQIADYAAMRLYSQANPARLTNFSRPTILKAVDAPLNSAVPLTLTAWDLAFLKSLYAMNPQRFAASQRNEIARQISRELDSNMDLR